MQLTYLCLCVAVISSLVPAAGMPSFGRYVPNWALRNVPCNDIIVWPQVAHPDNPPLVLPGHPKEVTAVSWCRTQLDKVGLQWQLYCSLYDCSNTSVIDCDMLRQQWHQTMVSTTNTTVVVPSHGIQCCFWFLHHVYTLTVGGRYMYQCSWLLH